MKVNFDAGLTTILLGGPNLGMPRSRKVVRLLPMLRHSWSCQKILNNQYFKWTKPGVKVA